VTREHGCVLVPVNVSLVGLVSLWVAAVALITWDTLGGPGDTGDWGLLASAAAAAWTVIYGLDRLHEEYDLLRYAFEMGRETTDEPAPSIRPVR
jgi:hypothetical protein